MEYVIGVILIIIAVMIVGLIFRKKVYDSVDRLEEWKMDIMNRNVTSELAKVKQLNLSGETQEKFEGWKENWDIILTSDLPDIEEYLMDAEEASDKFKIRTAKKQLQIVEETLQSIENNIEDMYKELDHLLDSEKYAREQIDELSPRIKELKKYLLHNRTHFGKAELSFETILFQYEKKLMECAQLAEEGNYLEAQEALEELKEEINQLEEKMSAFPDILKKCKQILPNQLKELLKGMAGMSEEGYRVEQFGFEKELRQYEQVLVQSLRALENGEVTSVYDTFEQMEDRLNEMYLLLEKEAKSKSLVESHFPNVQQKYSELKVRFHEMKEEINRLQETYFVEESDLELFLSIEKWLDKLTNQLQQLEQDYQNKKNNHIEIRDQLDVISNELDNLEQAQEEFQEQIRDLRKDEVEAKKQMAELKTQLIHTNKKLEKSNIPGIPSFILNALEEASDKCEAVLIYLQKHPLDIGKVQHQLQEANKSVDQFVHQTELVLDQARLVEAAIQYGNRYKRDYPVLAAQLKEAESLFRNYKYEMALEVAVKALEEVDPNAMVKIEQIEEEYQQMVP
ncbi:septation ring formation regulator EzrA [Gracilibacillus sp. YIM 98692]|uniref:septation ring formation regulator EzrA n=1 Tax=Gracilibacillus sp. YIM 98692 TaxID=2663532 RepID=UPI0013D6728B|nr:septation ring formation regulator EzrA [Gracilibacillus sp. YIM 98692]